MRRLADLALTLALMTVFAAGAHAIPIGGIEFPDGEVSFADAVIEYSPGPDVAGDWLDPQDALGIPDNDPVSLGNDGLLILQFLDNSLTTSGDDTPDIHVFEVGNVTEYFNLSISTNLIDWIDLGNVLGQPTSVDIDGVAGVVAGTQYSYVRLLDVAPDQTSSPFGEADIDAVGAISSAPPVPPPPSNDVPAPGILVLLAPALLGMRFARRLRGA